MPTATERARAEKTLWTRLAEHWTTSATPDLWNDRPPTEKSVILFHDPHPDLTRRTREWGYDLPAVDLSAVALFAAGLASAEAEGWELDKPDLATRAYESRRFLLGDRIVHWAVPWLDAVGRGYREYREEAHSDRDLLLRLADDARVAPALRGREGIRVAGEDSYGPIRQKGPLPGWLRSLWSGTVLLGKHLEPGADLAADYEEAAERWSRLAARHPGAAELWGDLSLRATTTAEMLRKQ